MQLEALKDFLRVDGSDEDTLISGLKLAAEEYLISSGVALDYSQELQVLAVKLMVSHWYENRGVIGSVEGLSHSLDSILWKLKYRVVRP